MADIRDEILSSCLEEEPRRIRFTGHLVLLAVVLATTLDSLCGGGLNTIGFPIGLLLLIGGLFLMKWYERVPFNKQNIAVLLPPLLFFATMVAVRDNLFLAFWNIAASKVFLLLLLYYCTNDSVLRMSPGAFLKLPWKVTGASIASAVPVVQDANEVFSDRFHDNEKTLPILRGVLLAIPVLAIFVGLLTSADAMFSKVMVNIGAALIPKDLMSLGWHIFAIVTMTWLIIGGIAYALVHRSPLPSVILDDVPAPSRWQLGHTETMIILGSVTGLFATFIAIQSSYFFGGVRYAQSLGLNYAEYARHGFWELLSVAVLTLFLIRCLLTLGHRSGITQKRAFYGLGTLLVGLTLVLLTSAMQRMHAYESVYGATPLRLYVDGFIIWLAVALCWSVATLWQWHDRFMFGVVACGVGYLVSLNIIDPDATVARRNVAQYQRTGQFCMQTIYKMSSDAIPELASAYRTMPAGPTRAHLGVFLHYHLESLHSRPEKFVERNIAREQAWIALKPMEAQLQESLDEVVGWRPESK